MIDDDGPDALENPDAPTITLEELRLSGRPMSVLERVEAAALGRIKLTSEQLQAAKLYLAKTAADLKSVEVNETHTMRVVSDAELDRRIAELLERARQASLAALPVREGSTH